MPKRKKSARPSLSTPKLNVGANYARDTTGVYALTPFVTISLPTFDRNQGNIAIEQASRQLLHEVIKPGLIRFMGQRTGW
jgi:hypothetical protein